MILLFPIIDDKKEIEIYETSHYFNDKDLYCIVLLLAVRTNNISKQSTTKQAIFNMCGGDEEILMANVSYDRKPLKGFTHIIYGTYHMT